MTGYLIFSALLGWAAFIGYKSGGGGWVASVLAGAVAFALWPLWPCKIVMDFFEGQALESRRLHGPQRW